MMTRLVNQENKFINQTVFINFLLFLVFVSFLVVSIQQKDLLQFCFSRISYYVILAMVMCWGWVLYFYCKKSEFSLKVFLKRHYKGILIALLLAGTVFASTPKCYRVLSDETNLLSVSKSMTFYKTVDNVTEGKWYYGMFWQSASSKTEKRPFLYPFSVSLLHNVLGYNPENAFVFNFIALWGVLFLVYLLVSPAWGTLISLGAMLTVIAQPMIALSATSASFEVFNLFFILFSFLSLRCFIANPSVSALLFLTVNLLMLANIRYESLLFLLVVALVLGIRKYLSFSYLKESTLWGVLPFFLLSLIWQRIVMSGVADSNLQGGSWIKSFSLTHVGHNLSLFLKYTLDMDGSFGYAGMINAIGICALIYWMVKGILDLPVYLRRERFVLWATAAISLTGIFILMLTYQGHIADHPMNGRLYIPVLVVLSLAAVLFLADLFKNYASRAAVVALLGAAFFIYYHPVAMEDRLSNQLYIIRDFRYVLDFMRQHADQNSLLICGRPGQYIVYNYGAVSFDTANRNKKEILDQYRNRLISKIYVVQEIAYTNYQPVATNGVDEAYQLTPVASIQGGAYYLRIAEVQLPRQTQ